MPVVIAELISRFSADTRDFEAGSKRVQAGLGAAESAVKSTASAMALMGREIKSAGAEFGSFSASLAAATGQAKALGSSLSALGKGLNLTPIKAYAAAVDGLGRSGSKLAGLRSEVAALSKAISSASGSMAATGRGAAIVGQAMAGLSRSLNPAPARAFASALSGIVASGAKLSGLAKGLGPVGGALAAAARGAKAVGQAMAGLSHSLNLAAVKGYASALNGLAGSKAKLTALKSEILGLNAAFGSGAAAKFQRGMEASAESVSKLKTQVKATEEEVKDLNSTLSKMKKPDLDEGSKGGSDKKKGKFDLEKLVEAGSKLNDGVIAPLLKAAKASDTLKGSFGETIEKMQSMSEKAGSVLEGVSSVVKVFGAFHEASMALTAALGIQTVATEGAETATAGLDATLLPEIAVLAAVAAAVYGLYKAYQWLTDAGVQTKEQIEKDHQANIADMKAKAQNTAQTMKLYKEFETLSKKTNKTTEESKHLQDIMNKLSVLNPQLATGYSKQGNAVGILAGKYENLAAAAYDAANAQRAASIADKYRDKLGDEISAQADLKQRLASGDLRGSSRADLESQIAAYDRQIAADKVDMKREQKSSWHKLDQQFNPKSKPDNPKKDGKKTVKNKTVQIHHHHHSSGGSDGGYSGGGGGGYSGRFVGGVASPKIEAMPVQSLQDIPFSEIHENLLRTAQAYRLIGKNTPSAVDEDNLRYGASATPQGQKDGLDIALKALTKDEKNDAAFALFQKSFDKLGSKDSQEKAEQLALEKILDKADQAAKEKEDNDRKLEEVKRTADEARVTFLKAQNKSPEDQAALDSPYHKLFSQLDPNAQKEIDEQLDYRKKLAVLDPQPSSSTDDAGDSKPDSFQKLIDSINGETAKQNSRTPEDRIQAMVDEGMAEHEDAYGNDPAKKAQLESSLRKEAVAKIDREYFDNATDATKKLNEELASFGKQTREARVAAYEYEDGVRKMQHTDAEAAVALEDKVNAMKKTQEQMQQIADAGSKAISDTLEQGLDHGFKGLFASLVKNLREQIKAVLMEMANAKIQAGLEKLFEFKQKSSSGSAAPTKTTPTSGGPLDPANIEMYGKSGGPWGGTCFPGGPVGGADKGAEQGADTAALGSNTSALTTLTGSVNSLAARMGTGGDGGSDGFGSYGMPSFLGLGSDGSSYGPGVGDGTQFAADGGPYGPGPLVVGERGPELLVPSGSGRVISNSDLSDMVNGRGQGDVHVHNHFHGPVPTDRRSHDQIAKHTYEAARKAQLRYR